MSKSNQKSTRTVNGETGQRSKRETFAITQKGIRDDQDLFAFLNAALSDIDSGRTNIEEMRAMTSISRQIIALQNLRLKAGVLQRTPNSRKLLLKGTPDSAA